MREVRNGLSRETRSLNGNGRRACCFGFMVNVRVSFPLHFRISNEGSVLQRGRERVFFRAHHSTPVDFLMTDIFD
jgi:hypothetical protein